MTRATDDALGGLHEALAKALALKIAEGTATAADLAVAAKFLKDNNITAVPAVGSPMRKLVDQLDEPFDEDAEIERLTSVFTGPISGTA